MSEVKRVPKLRFNEFSDVWRSHLVNDVCKINPKSNNLPESFIYVDLESVTDGILLSENRISKNEAPSRAQRLLEKNDILYQTVRPYQKNNLFFDRNETDFVASTGYAQIRTKEIPKFIFQYLLTERFVNKILLKCTGTSYPSINSSDLGNTEINVPQLPEQQKIATFLSSVDKKINQLQQKKSHLERYKKGVMQQLFSQQLRFKDENGNEYPEWEEKKLGEVFKIGSGKDYKHLKEGVIPVFGTGGQMTLVDDYLYDGDSVGIGRKGTIDKPVFLQGKFWTVDTLFYTHSFKKVIPKFIYYVFLKINWKKYNEASGVPSLSKSTIEKIDISISSLQEQTKIANFLSAIDNKIELVNSQIENTQQFKKGLLQQMFV